MPDLNRRSFLKTTAALGTALALPKTAEAGPKAVLSPDRMGVLVDTTVCIGCRNCEYACKTAHDLPTEPLETYEDQKVFASMRRPDEKTLTVVNRYPNPQDGVPTNVKVQCMHCDHPACVSACIVGAFSKEENGAVIWDTKKCIGCRYCMVACPFQVPAFEYHKALEPKVVKCDFCYDRRKDGKKLPACVEACPVEALTFGPREELVRVARDRVKRNPQRYIDHLFGEYEVGGTSWMYMAGRDFADLQFPKLGKNPAPGVSESIQHGIFAYFVPPVALYGLLGVLMWISKGESHHEGEE